MPTEKLTEDLLKRLLGAKSPEEYLDQGETLDRELDGYLHQLLDEREGMKRADVVRASKLNSTVVYDIFGGKSLPGRDHAIMLAFGLHCEKPSGSCALPAYRSYGRKTAATPLLSGAWKTG